MDTEESRDAGVVEGDALELEREEGNEERTSEQSGDCVAAAPLKQGKKGTEEMIDTL